MEKILNFVTVNADGLLLLIILILFAGAVLEGLGFGLVSFIRYGFGLDQGGKAGCHRCNCGRKNPEERRIDNG